MRNSFESGSFGELKAKSKVGSKFGVKNLEGATHSVIMTRGHAKFVAGHTTNSWDLNEFGSACDVVHSSK
jgi:hypothetical protein